MVQYMRHSYRRMPHHDFPVPNAGFNYNVVSESNRHKAHLSWSPCLGGEAYPNEWRESSKQKQ